MNRQRIVHILNILLVVLLLCTVVYTAIFISLGLTPLQGVAFTLERTG